MGDEVNFLPTDKHESFLQVDITLGLPRQVFLNTQNDKFTICLQYLKENVKEEVDFLPVDKRQSFFQIDTVILGVCGQACPNYPKEQVCYFFAIS